MEYSLHFTFREEWTDERLYFESPTLEHIVLTPGQRIWIPDTFFQNEKDGKKHEIDTPNVLVRVHNATGRVLYSVRLTLTLSCPMRLNDYPLDVQHCFIDFASYAYTSDDIVYEWKSVDPIQRKAGLRQSLPSFVLNSVTTGNCTSVTTTGVYSCLRTVIELRREFSYYLLQLYVPSFMLVVVSWVSFWLDKDSVPARVTLGVTTLLTMVTQASGIQANLPVVSYIKAIDVWIGVSLAFVFGALLEFALVNWAARRDAMTRGRRGSAIPLPATLIHPPYKQPHHLQASCYFPISTPASLDGVVHRQLVTTTVSTSEIGIVRERAKSSSSHSRGLWHRLWNERYRERSRRIDLISRMFFPGLYLIFNLSYWHHYLWPYLAVRASTSAAVDD